MSTKPLIEIDATLFEFEKCQLCNDDQNVKRITLGQTISGIRQTTSIKLCQECAFNLVEKIDECY